MIIYHQILYIVIRYACLYNKKDIYFISMTTREVLFYVTASYLLARQLAVRLPVCVAILTVRI